MLCAKYQEVDLCGSREKCDKNYLVSKYLYVHNIQSRVKQEVGMRQIQNCVTRYSSPYWCSEPNIRKLTSVVLEKNVTEIILWVYQKAVLSGYREKCDRNFFVTPTPTMTTTLDDGWWSLYVASAIACRRHNKVQSEEQSAMNDTFPYQ